MGFEVREDDRQEGETPYQPTVSGLTRHGTMKEVFLDRILKIQGRFHI
jgi:hypothetical protein